MSRLTFQNGTFRCHLACQQCEYIKPNGLRCKNRVCFGVPLCWIHTKKEYGLRVRPSTLQGAGKGLFTVKNIARGTWICPYLGEVIDLDCLEKRYPGDAVAPYTTTGTNDDDYVDSACQRGIASMANGNFRGDKPRAKRDHNADIEVKKKRRNSRGEVWLRALKNIPAGEEIFVWYGNEYRLEDDHSTVRKRKGDNRPC